MSMTCLDWDRTGFLRVVVAAIGENAAEMPAAPAVDGAEKKPPPERGGFPNTLALLYEISGARQSSRFR